MLVISKQKIPRTLAMKLSTKQPWIMKINTKAMMFYHQPILQKYHEHFSMGILMKLKH